MDRIPKFRFFNCLDHPIAFLHASADGRILDITKKEPLLAGVRGSNPQAAIQETVLKKKYSKFLGKCQMGKWKTQEIFIFRSRHAYADARKSIPYFS